jgi:hypothetical protein
MNFVAIDFETANPDLSSICQVGIAAFADGNLSGKWESLINPEDYFDPFNVSIHGITEEDVAHSPKWREIYPEIGSRLHGAVAVSHTAFRSRRIPPCLPAGGDRRMRMHLARFSSSCPPDLDFCCASGLWTCRRRRATRY